jgi:hypothetical protein
MNFYSWQHEYGGQHDNEVLNVLVSPISVQVPLQDSDIFVLLVCSAFWMKFGEHFFF